MGALFLSITLLLKEYAKENYFGRNVGMNLRKLVEDSTQMKLIKLQ